MSKFSQSIKDFINQLLGRKPVSADPNAVFVQKLMQRLAVTQEEELGCEDVFEVMDIYAEAIKRGEDVSEVMPLVKHHLEMCGNCHEEFDMLLEMMEVER